MKIIIGLGNPGLKYKNNRHNVGFMAIDYIKNNLESNDFIFDKTSNSKISKYTNNSKKVFLVKPQTYMNNSGFTAKEIVSYYKLNPSEDLLVIYDDIDLPLADIRSKGRSSGGHKGMQSIINNLNTSDINRVRIGILGEKNKFQDTANYVLQDFTKTEKENLEDSFEKLLNITNKFIKNN